MRKLRAIALGGVLAALSATAAPASAARLETIDAPSRYVDPATAAFANGGHVEALRANVLLPDGYDASGRRRYPVLYLLHATGNDYRTWAEPEGGRIEDVARGLDAIVVMPEAGLGFLTNWWNDGRRGDPAWERYYLEELVPLVERRYRVRPGRRWHAIAGWSMGGLGATFLAGQRPGYFGTAVSLSGFVSIQRPYLQSLWEPATGIDYGRLWGPSDAFYAEGHNPAALAGNLRHTRLVVTAGDGRPRPGVAFGPGGPGAAPFQGILEEEVRFESDDLVAAARAADVDVAYLAHDGIHDWPYAREDLSAAIERGLFEPVPEGPTRWAYRTVARTGEAWGLAYSFARPPEEVVTLRRAGPLLAGEGSGTVTVTTPGGCEVAAALPFERRLPRGRCTSGRLRLTVSPHRVRAGARRRLAFRATTLLRGRSVPVAGALVTVRGRSVTTGADGRASATVPMPARRALLRVRATKPGLRAAGAAVRVLAR
ncbi:MAG TPA: alpha/beta hydrolase-fold protein [Thermoleophilaceae bacterium]|jgi:S-formylglutathione hydrolase FrmB